MKRACEVSWPPPEGVPYVVDGLLGQFVEVVMPGAFELAVACGGERALVVAADEWNADFSRRTIKCVTAVSVS